MANTDDKGGQPVPSGNWVNVQDLGKAIGDAVAAGIAATTRRKVTAGEYAARPDNPFNPRRVRLKRESYQNGIRMQSTSLTVKEIQLLNQITHSGRYINRLVAVLVSENEGAEEEVDIRWNNKTRDQQMNFKGEVRSFEELLEKVVAAQKEEDELERQRQHPPRQHFGGQATQDARKAAESR